MQDILLHHRFNVWIFDVMIKNRGNLWLYGHYSSMYLRYFMRRIEIANVQVMERYQHKGIFKNFLSHVESFGIPIKIENVLNPDLLKFLEQREGYTAKYLGGIPSLYRD